MNDGRLYCSFCVTIFVYLLKIGTFYQRVKKMRKLKDYLYEKDETYKVTLNTSIDDKDNRVVYSAIYPALKNQNTQLSVCIFNLLLTKE